MTNYQDQVRMLLDAGLEEDAKAIEEKVRKLNPHLWIGSVFTEKWLDKFLTQDEEMLILKQQIRILAAHNDCVLIQGETGTGKELLARALHASRPGKFEAINCAAIPEQLLESILFGHQKGSFTDAKTDNPGLMRTCWNGTLFIDEVGEMPAILQGKLLRALQPDDKGKRYIRPIGDNEEREINCRFVFASNKAVYDSKTFRDDLYYRISTFQLYTKPLRDRPEDATLIVKSLWPEIEEKDLKKILEAAAAAKFMGNVRWLQNLVRRMQVFK